MLNLNGLNPRQRQAVEAIQGPVLILAGAGTGKTRVITYRIVHLIERGIQPGHILAVTFTNKAAREMQERVASLLRKTGQARTGSAKAERPTLCTFHSLCVRILRRFIDRLGYRPNFVIYDESEQLSLVRKILSRISVADEKLDPREILSGLSRLKNSPDRPDAFPNPSLAAWVRHVRPHYDQALRACNAVDFDDLISLTLRLFQEFPDVLEACREQYRHVMVDEYQDTNAAQFQLVQGLARQHRNLCVVGDDDQSIYAWRGAEISNLLNFEQYFAEAKIIKLEQNYRSTPNILAAANALIQKNARRRPKALWSENRAGEKITLHVFPDEQEEARKIAEEIEYGRRIHRIPWADQAILFRTNLQSRPLETALRQNNIRYHLIGGQSFFDRREIRDFLAFLKLFLNPHDDVSLLRVANVPPRGISEATCEKLLAYSAEHRLSVFAAMRDPGARPLFQKSTLQSLDRFVQWVTQHSHKLQANSVASPRAWAEQFLDEIKYWDDVRRLEKDAEAAENRVRNLRDLIETLEESAPAGHSAVERLQGFLEELALDQDREEEEQPDQEAVTLITMHSCKGLEFPHVYVVGLEDGLLPHTRSKEEGTLDEERRLFYVAITRAMRTLTLSHCLSRKKYGEMVPCHPSPFLSELPADLIESAEEKGKAPVSVESGKSRFDSLRASL